MSSHTIPKHQKTSIVDRTTTGWLESLPPARGAMALYYISNLMTCGVPEKAAVEIVYKTGLFVVANRCK